MTDQIETHPLEPFLPSNAKLLMLGSFPPPKIRWKMDFYYPNFQNDMWRIVGAVFFDDKDYFIDVENKGFKEQLLKDFLNGKGIAIFDTAYQVIRQKNNASDKFLQIVQATDLAKLLQQIPQCGHILTTGEKATSTLLTQFPEMTIAPTIAQSSVASIDVENVRRELTLYRLPSTSRAYPLAFDQKVAHYRQFFQQVGIL
ncbi:G/U mismatch-specific uracil-DNA glycosylase [Acinetobacter marinus]|uniref:G/U mismatch-specific uracil-DNA glycosylase n=1 Tax=Acinetobacter marinus TaxID=281375 RepID=A0A1G6GWW1_9GAMM|nr:uracil-DNA glycosylase family protein [Acinetobacter marinus]SDB86155.1 G/U mismatch-specific uracil-DNA glycosylase [Acinetobacter marinus]